VALIQKETVRQVSFVLYRAQGLRAWWISFRSVGSAKYCADFKVYYYFARSPKALLA